MFLPVDGVFFQCNSFTDSLLTDNSKKNDNFLKFFLILVITEV